MLGGQDGPRAHAAEARWRGPATSTSVILIDCPPSLGLLTVNALVAADYALITAEAQYFALQGVEQAMEVVELARESLNPELALLGVLLNLADMRTVHSREALASLKERFGDAGVRDGDPLLDRVRGVGRARALDPRPPSRPRRRLRRGRRRDHRADPRASPTPAATRAAQLRAPDVGALRLERRAQHARPSPRPPRPAPRRRSPVCS